MGLVLAKERIIVDDGTWLWSRDSLYKFDNPSHLLNRQT